MNRDRIIGLLAATGLLLATAGPARAGAGDCVTPTTGTYGTAGPYTTAVHAFPHPLTPAGQVRVYAPAGAEGPRPVVFFAHAFAADDPETYYRAFIDRLVSTGTIVVYSPYSTVHAVIARKDAYAQLWAGFAAAVDRYAGSLRMDLDRVGFVGHSFGGGATPEMFRRGVIERGWGADGRFMAIFAPYKVFEPTPEQMAAFPPDSKLLIQVYDEDDTNDHRFAIEQIWKPLAATIPAGNRDYVVVRSATNGACSLPSDHGVPMNGGGRYGKLDAYDDWAVWRQTTALMGCTFDRDPAGCEIALGHGSAQQTDMGRWKSDGTEVPGLVSMAEPVPTNCDQGQSCTFKYGGSPLHDTFPGELPGGDRSPTSDRQCFWAAQDDPSLLNVAFPDSAANYWLGTVALPPGARMELRGRYPYARYMSFNVYNPQLAPFDGLGDSRISPDVGSENPMVPGAQRGVLARSYTVTIVGGAPPAQRAPNTIYAGSAPAAAMLYRVYVPDTGRDDTGGVGLPEMTLILADGTRLEGARACAVLDAAEVPPVVNEIDAGASTPAPPAPVGPATDPLEWALFANAVYSTSVWLRGTPLEPAREVVPKTRSGGFLSNVDNQYVSAIGHRSLGPVLVLEGTAPRTPRTEAGNEQMEEGDLRYWSLCTNDRPSTRVVGCVFDEHVPLRAGRRYTVVVSQPGDRPANARPECGVAWLPWGADPESLVILRHMLPNPGFAQAIQQIPDLGREQETMGEYLPSGNHTTTAEFETRGC